MKRQRRRSKMWKISTPNDFIACESIFSSNILRVGMRRLCWFAAFRCAKHLNSAKLSRAATFLLERRGFSLSTITHHPYFFRLFLIVLSRVLTFSILTENFKVCDAVSLSIAQSDLGVNLLGRPLLTCYKHLNANSKLSKQLLLQKCSQLLMLS